MRKPNKGKKNKKSLMSDQYYMMEETSESERMHLKILVLK